MNQALSGIVLAAGFGTRMKSRSTPKVLFPLLGRPLLAYPVGLLAELGCRQIVVVVGNGAEQVKAAFPSPSVPPRDARQAPGSPFGGASVPSITWALQDPPRGTGDATRIGLRALSETTGPVVILNGDLPLLRRATLQALIDDHRDHGAALTLLTLDLVEPRGYGRVVRTDDGDVGAIVEDADATPVQRAIREVNGGVYIADPTALAVGLEHLMAAGADNAQGEFYLPPVLHPIRAAGGVVRGWKLPSGQIDELQQVNDRVELAKASSLRKAILIEEHQRRGVTIVDPATTYIEEDVEIGIDTVIHPHTTIVRGVRIGAGCAVGPAAHLREGTVLHDGAEIGNFTEVKNTVLGAGAKAKHLSYLGDGIVGKGANIGAGTIFANYDGKAKHTTRIGEHAFVGSGTVFVAPAVLGDGASTGAGAVVKRGTEVPAGETVVGVPARPLTRRVADGNVEPENVSRSDAPTAAEPRPE
ncbi:MAG: bifunctional N-acetylglucosamine-1-phosphate uridyltransferase/glucosamine-1-phosphate acetyltransferase [Planctomycetota bacterium]